MLVKFMSCNNNLSYYFLQNNMVHQVKVQCHNVHLDEWKIDDDYCSYLSLCEDVFAEFLGTQYLERLVQVNRKAYIKGGLYIVNVVDDNSVIKMFRLNTHNNDHIDLYVELDIAYCWF